MGRLEVMEVGLMDADGLFELLNVFGSAFSEGSLSLSVSLLSFFGRGIDLWCCLLVAIQQWHCYVSVYVSVEARSQARAGKVFVFKALLVRPRDARNHRCIVDVSISSTYETKHRKR